MEDCTFTMLRSKIAQMKRVVILATAHEYQCAGHFLNSVLEQRLTYLCESTTSALEHPTKPRPGAPSRNQREEPLHGKKLLPTQFLQATQQQTHP